MRSRRTPATSRSRAPPSRARRLRTGRRPERADRTRSGSPSFATSTATSDAACSISSPTSPRGTPSPIRRRRPSVSTRSIGSRSDDVGEVEPGIARGARHAPRDDSISGGPLAHVVDRPCGLFERQIVGLSPADPRARAAWRAYEARDDQLARRHRPGQRLGQCDQPRAAPRWSAERPGSTVWHRQLGMGLDGRERRVRELVLDPTAEFVLGIEHLSSGPAISVVTTAMITSIANNVLEIAPASRATLRTINSVSRACSSASRSQPRPLQS